MVPLSYAIRAASASSVSKLSDPAAEKVEQAVAKWDSNSFSAHPAEKLSRSMEYSPSIIFFFFLSPVAPVVALQSQLNLTRRPSLKVLL